jgi:hypothetical protein
MLMNDQPAMADAAPNRLSVPRIAIVVAALLALLVLYRGTVASMVSVWNAPKPSPTAMPSCRSACG